MTLLILLFSIRLLAWLKIFKFLSFLEKVVKEGVDILSADKTVELLKMPALESLTSSKSSELNKRNLTCVWCLESEMEGIEIEDKDHVRIRTKGNGPYLGKVFLLNINLRFCEEYIQLSESARKCIFNLKLCVSTETLY